MDNPRVAAAVTTDTAAIAEVLAEAFENDPVMGWLVPAARRRPVAYRRFFDFESRHHALGFPDSLIATSAGQILGAALVLPPGSWRTPLIRQIRHGRDFTGIFRARLPRALRLQSQMERHHPHEPHYYLPFIGVASTAQRGGVGSLLLQEFTRRCDAAQMPAYLEATNTDNARLYRRHGFETLDHLCVGSCPPLERMWRRPAGSDPIETRLPAAVPNTL